MYNPYTTEAWVEYAISLSVIFIRIGYRCSVVGWNWAGDDYIAAFAVPLWTVCARPHSHMSLPIGEKGNNV